MKIQSEYRGSRRLGMVIDERRGARREKYHFTPDDETIGLDTKSVENFLSRNSKRFLDSFLLSLCFVAFLCADYMQNASAIEIISVY